MTGGEWGEPDPRLVVAYEESVRQLEHQVKSVDELRGRISVLLAAGAISTSFLGQAGLREGDLTEPFVLLALTSLLVLTFSTIWILWPQHWRFTNDPEAIIGGYVDGPNPRTIRDTHRWLAEENHMYFLCNKVLLRNLYRWFRVACIALVFSILFWLPLLGDR